MPALQYYLQWLAYRSDSGISLPLTRNKKELYFGRNSDALITELMRQRCVVAFFALRAQTSATTGHLTSSHVALLRAPLSAVTRVQVCSLMPQCPYNSFIALSRLSFSLISHSPPSAIPSFPADKENLLRFILLLLAQFFGAPNVRARD